MKKFMIMPLLLLCCTMANALEITIGTGFGKRTLTDGETITITEVEHGLFGDEMKLEGDLNINGSSLTVEITRSEAGIDDQLCAGKCDYGNKDLTQTMNFTIASGSTGWYAHLTPVAGKEFTIVYMFIDGTETLTLTVVYDCTNYSQGLFSPTMTTVAQKGVYTIFGQRLSENDNTDGLPTGMYIVNGKKVIVK